MKLQIKTKLDIQKTFNGEPFAGVGPGAGFTFAKAYFPKANEFLRIATGYFSVKGYDLCRAFFFSPCAIENFSWEREGMHVQEAIRKEIQRELIQGDSGSLYEAVFDLVNRINTGKFQIWDAREMQRPFHCKFYISDTLVLWHGSANFSTNGLLYQAEQVTVSTDQDHIKSWIEWFEDTSINAKDLLAEILEVLEQWLKLARPFDAYLKALYFLYGIPESGYQKGAHLPVYYQLSLIAWALRSLRSNNGAVAVVATGLGKTVIGSEVAARLFNTREIDSVILIAPKVVHKAWKKQLTIGRKVTPQVFGDKVLFLPSSGQGKFQADELEEALANADERTLIIIDEAHIYRNQLKGESYAKPSLVLRRISKATNQKAKVLLLTGSAYGTSILNLNSLLALLPLRIEPETEPWSVQTHTDFVELDPVCVLGIPHVQRMAIERGDIDENGKPFIDFGNSRKYLPQNLISIIITFKPPFFEEALQAFDERYFKQKKQIPTSGYDDEAGFIDAVSDSVENISIKSWLSSPKAFTQCIRQNLATQGEDPQIPISFSVANSNNQQQQPKQTALWQNNEVKPLKEVKKAIRSNKKISGYKAILKLCQKNRAIRLEPLLTKLSGDIQDSKFTSLVSILNERCRQDNSKAVIFVEFHLTAIYLENALNKAFGKKLKIGSTVCKSKISLKSFPQREDLIHRISPLANDKAGPGDLDVLICTDADGIGINMQDADTVINYDISGGADVLVQRLGRILRPTTDANRTPHIYTFLPNLNSTQIITSKTFRLIKMKMERFRKRYDKSSDILGAPSLSANQEGNISLSRDVDLEKLFYNQDDFSKAALKTSLAEHLCILEANREDAQNLPEPLCSTFYYAEDLPRLFLLLKHGNQYFTLIYKPDTETIETETDLVGLNWIKCTMDEPLAAVSPGFIHKLADTAIALWAVPNGFDVAEIERKITVYLQPNKLKQVLFKQLNNNKP